VPPKITTGRPEPATPYHRLGRTDRYRWWKSLLALPLILIVTLVAGITLLVPMFIIDQALDPGAEPPGDALLNNPLLDGAALLLTVAVLLPAVWLGVRAVEGRSLGWVSSVAGRLRWRWLALTVAPIAALVILGFVAFIVMGSLVEPDPGEAESAPVQWGLLLGGLAVIVVLVPVQAAAEEYFFRGFLMQLIGGYLRNPWFGVAITSVLFAVAHVDFQWTRLVSLTAFGVVAAVLTLYTGGLEAGIVLHTVNNVLAFGLGAVAGTPPTGDPSAAAMPWWMAALDVMMVAAVLVVILWLARRRRVARTVAAVG
jgi:membrane protease YdiL (CAAX protease family)